MAAVRHTKNRNVAFVRVKAGDLLPHPKNWRTHPESQRQALRGVLSEVGYVGTLLARETPDGMQLIDGHLRAETLPDEEVDVCVVDLTDAETDLILALHDPLADMAEADADQLARLLDEIETSNADLSEMLSDLAQENGLLPAAPKERAVSLEPEYSVLVKCGDEADQRVLLEELDNHGLETRALCIGWPQAPPLEQKDDKPLAVDEKRIVRKTSIKRTARIKQLAGIYDMPPKTESKHVWSVQFTLDRPWNVGLIVGPSGCGKTTIAREIFGDKIVTGWPWPKDRSIVDGFPADMAIGDIVNLLSSVGFSSPPHWLKPFHVLSNGEQFRVTLARTMAEMPDLAVVDEFTSVVDRTVAQLGSSAVAKAVRAANRRLVAVACHYDIEEWLQPDWKYEPATGEFHWRRLRRRPEIQLSIQRVEGKRAWPLFRGHHYLSGELHRSAACFMGTINKQPAVFTAVLSQPGRASSWRESRTVCLPDFQGVGIGNAMSAFVASLYRATGKPYRSTTSHPAMIAHRCRSPLWRLIRAPGLASPTSSVGFGQFLNTAATARLTAGFEYIGPADEENARRLGVLKPAKAA